MGHKRLALEAGEDRYGTYRIYIGIHPDHL